MSDYWRQAQYQTEMAVRGHGAHMSADERLLLAVIYMMFHFAEELDKAERKGNGGGKSV